MQHMYIFIIVINGRHYLRLLNMYITNALSILINDVISLSNVTSCDNIYIFEAIKSFTESLDFCNCSWLHELHKFV